MAVQSKIFEFGPLYGLSPRNKGLPSLEEIHSRAYENHFVGYNLGNKMLNQSYWLPYIKEHTQVVLKHCDFCHKHENIIHLPTKELNPLFFLGPLHNRALILLEHGNLSPIRRDFLLVAIEYFKKQIKVRALETITAHDARKFIWKDIIGNFGLPHTISQIMANSLISRR